MKKLIQGIIDFRKNSLQEYRAKFSELALGQKPDALMIACCDSRVVPNVFASSDPGELFVVRNVGNLIPSYHSKFSDENSVSAALEYALVNLEVRDIIVCGHSDCGAMHAILQYHEEDSLSFVGAWLQNALPSYRRFISNVDEAVCDSKNHNPCNCLSKINVLEQIEHLKTYPLVLERLSSNQLQLHGWWFDLATANIYRYDHKVNSFILIT